MRLDFALVVQLIVIGLGICISAAVAATILLNKQCSCRFLRLQYHLAAMPADYVLAALKQNW